MQRVERVEIIKRVEKVRRVERLEKVQRVKRIRGVSRVWRVKTVRRVRRVSPCVSCTTFDPARVLLSRAQENAVTTTNHRRSFVNQSSH